MNIHQSHNLFSSSTQFLQLTHTHTREYTPSLPPQSDYTPSSIVLILPASRDPFHPLRSPAVAFVGCVSIANPIRPDLQSYPSAAPSSRSKAPFARRPLLPEIPSSELAAHSRATFATSNLSLDTGSGERAAHYEMPSRLDAPVLTVDAGLIHKVDTRNVENLFSMWTGELNSLRGAMVY